MTKLRAAFSTLIVIIGVTQSLSDLIEDPEYRPWDLNDTSTAGIFLSAIGIKSLNTMFRINIPNLKWLVLDDNKIRSVSLNAFESFPELTYLSLVRNDVNQIEPGTIAVLPKLEVLNLDGNPHFLNSPINNDQVFNEFPSLKRLYLRDCEIKEFLLPGLISRLTHLHLARNRLQTFYTTEESSLTHLYLHDNRLRYVSLSKFKNLTYFNADRNEFTSIMRRSKIPPADYMIKYITNGYDQPRTKNYELYLDPEDDTGLYLDDAAATLQYLRIWENELLRIEPDSFQDSKALIHVDLSSNRLVELGANTFNDLPQLEIISLDFNQIKKINSHAFKNLPNLKTLSLKYNQIVEIDEDLFTGLNSSANLEVSLFLDYNQIQILRTGAFKEATGFKHISLTYNRIKTISSQAFVNLPNLESIVIEWHAYPSFGRGPLILEEFSNKSLIESNAFSNLPNLISIKIRDYYFTHIEPRAFHDLPKLQSLDLSKNRIKNISSEAFFNLPALETLDLSKNLILTIEPNTFPQSLKYLDLAWNYICPRSDCWHLEELVNLEKINFSNTLDQFAVNVFAGLPKNLTIIMYGQEEFPYFPRSCY